MGQLVFTGTVINSDNGQPIKNGIIQYDKSSDIVTTDSLGKFIIYTANKAPLVIKITTLNCAEELVLDKADSSYATVIINCNPVELLPIQIQYQDAYTIVQKAFTQIPKLYANSSYLSYGFYRNYKKINNQFKELTECKLATVMRIDTLQGKLNCDEAFGILAIRRTLYTIALENFYDNQLTDLFNQNLVYHNAFAAFAPGLFPYTTFAIDSASNDSAWVISYSVKKFSGENHGIENFTLRAFPGEAFETGFITINKSDYAITKLIRESIRNQKYQYPENNNFLLPDRLYTGWFEEGFLEINFEHVHDKYFLKSIFHAYTNTFIHVPTNMVEYKITDYSEWIADSIGYKIDEPLLVLLNAYKTNEKIKYLYQPDSWQTTSPWYFINKETVLAGFAKRGEIEELFRQGGE